jgi:hypothetical protein
LRKEHPFAGEAAEMVTPVFDAAPMING